MEIFNDNCVNLQGFTTYKLTPSKLWHTYLCFNPICLYCFFIIAAGKFSSLSLIYKASLEIFSFNIRDETDQRKSSQKGRNSPHPTGKITIFCHFWSNEECYIFVLKIDPIRGSAPERVENHTPEYTLCCERPLWQQPETSGKFTIYLTCHHSSSHTLAAVLCSSVSLANSPPSTSSSLSACSDLSSCFSGQRETGTGKWYGLTNCLVMIVEPAQIWHITVV
jgi:hypothetical protein